MILHSCGMIYIWASLSVFKNILTFQFTYYKKEVPSKVCLIDCTYDKYYNSTKRLRKLRLKTKQETRFDHRYTTAVSEENWKVRIYLY